MTNLTHLVLTDTLFGTQGKEGLTLLVLGMEAI